MDTQELLNIVRPIPTDDPWDRLKQIVENNLAACDPKMGKWSQGAYDTWKSVSNVMQYIEERTDGKTNKLISM